MFVMAWLGICIAWVGAYVFGVSIGRYKEQQERKRSPELITPRILRGIENNLAN